MIIKNVFENFLNIFFSWVPKNEIIVFKEEQYKTTVGK